MGGGFTTEVVAQGRGWPREGRSTGDEGIIPPGAWDTVNSRSAKANPNEAHLNPSEGFK